MEPPYTRRVQIVKQALSKEEFVKQSFKHLVHDIKVIFIAVFTLLYSLWVLCVSVLMIILMPLLVFVYPYIAALLYRSKVKTRPNPFLSKETPNDES